MESGWLIAIAPQIAKRCLPFATQSRCVGRTAEYVETRRYNSMLDVCAKARNRRGVERIFFRMVKERAIPDEFTYSSLPRTSAATRDVKRAMAWLERLVDAGLEPGVGARTAVADACARIGDAEEAERVVAEIGDVGLKPSLRSFTALLRVHARRPGGRGVQRTKELVAEMHDKGLELDLGAYTELLACFATAGDWSGVDAILSQMKSRGVRPSSASFEVIMDGCCNQGDVKKAEAFLFRAMEEGIDMTLNLLNAFLKAVSRAGKPEFLEKWLGRMRQMHGLHPNVATYNALLSAYAESGQTPDAERIFTSMVESGPTPDIITYTTLIRAFAKIGSPEGAERWLHRMVDDGTWEPDVIAYNVVLEACARCGDLPRLWRVRHQMESRGVKADAYTFTIVSLPYSRRGDLERVEALMVQSAEAGFPRQLREFTCLFGVYANAWPVPEERAMATLREMVKAGCQPNDQVITLLTSIGRS